MIDISEEQLRKIIREEVRRVIREEQIIQEENILAPLPYYLNEFKKMNIAPEHLNTVYCGKSSNEQE